MKKFNKKKFLSLLSAFFVASIPSIATDVNNYEELVTAVGNSDAKIDVAADINDVTTALNIDYQTAMSSNVEGTVRAITNSSNEIANLFVVGAQGDVKFTDLDISNSTPDGNITILTNDGIINANNVTLKAGTNSALINNATGKVALNNTVIQNNTAGENGGAVNNSGEFSIVGTTNIASNKALDGGAIYNSAEGTITIAGTTFTENMAEKNGGAVNNLGQFTATNVAYTANTAANGGAVYNAENGYVTVTGSTFAKNTATENGGAIYNISAGTEENAGLVLNGVTFGDGTEENVNSAVNGGALYNAGTVSLSNNSVFNSNTAEKNGGAVYNVGKLNTADGTVGFTANKAANGGAVYNAENGYVTVTGSTFAKNTATENGGAIYNASAGTEENAGLVLNGVTFGDGTEENANSAVNGGALYNAGAAELSNNTSFNFNNASAKGGAVYNSGKLTSAVETINFVSNTAEDGGAIYNAEEAAGAFANATFAKNKAVNGGAIYNASAGTEENAGLVLNGVTFGDGTEENANNAVNGGAVYNAGTLGISGNASFNKNLASENGGAVYNTGTLYLTPGEEEVISFKGNLASYNAETAEGKSNAIYNTGTIVLNGKGAVNTSDSINGEGILSIIGEGSFNVTAENATDTAISQKQIKAEAGTITLNGNDANVTMEASESAVFANDVINMNNRVKISSADLTINTPVVNVTGENNYISGEKVEFAGTVEKPMTVTVGDGENSAQLFLTPAGSLTVNDNVKIDVAKDSILTLNTDNGDINVKGNNSSINVGVNGVVNVAGTNAEKSVTMNSIVTSADDTAVFNITGQDTVYNLASNHSGFTGKYNQDAATVNVSNIFFGTKEGSAVVNGGTINFNKGASLANSNLTIDKSTVTFNENTSSAIVELKASENGGYVIYGSDKINLNQANVTINNGYVLSAQNADENTEKIEIGNGSKGINTLTLNNSGLAEDASVKLTGGVLNVTGNATLAKNSAVEVDENSKVNIYDIKENTLVVGSNLSGSGTINTTNAELTFTGDSSNFNGKYNLDGGITEFVKDSTFFGDGIDINVKNNGEIIFNEGVIFKNTQNVDIPVINSTVYNKTKDSTADISTGKVTVDPEKVVTLNLTNSDLVLEKYSVVTNSTDSVSIGNNGTGTVPIKNLLLGVEEYNDASELVTFAPAQNSVIHLYNENNDEKTGILAFGNNVVIENNDVSTTVDLGKNTNLVLEVSSNGNLNNKDFKLNIQTTEDAYAVNNGVVSKYGDGTIYLTGDNSKFHGTVDVRNGEIALKDNSTLIGSDSKYNLSNVESNATVKLSPLHNVTANGNMDIIGIKLADNASANISNIYEDGSVIVAGNTLVDNNSLLDITAGKSIEFAETTVGTAAGNTKATMSVKAPTIKFNNNEAVLVSGPETVMNLSGDTEIAKDFIIKHATVNMNGNMNIGGNYSVGSTVNMLNGEVNTQHVSGNMTVTDNTDYKIDINGATLQSDNVYIDGILNTDGQVRNLNISDVNIIYDPKPQYAVFDVFSDSQSRGDQDIVNLAFTSSAGLINSPVGKYVMNPVGNGKYMLARVGYQPYVLGGEVASHIGLYNQLISYETAFANGDLLMMLPKKEREAYKNANRYAANDSDLDDTTTDVKGLNTKHVYESYKLPKNNVGGWFRPYGTFEKVSLHDGPDVGNNMYGAYAGVDSDVVSLGKGFDGSLGFYAGYDGSRQTFDGVGIYQNGATVGLSGSLFKGDFFSLSTINVGTSFADQTSILGKSDFWLMRYGIANKTGYNWDLADGRFIIQPHVTMSLSGANTSGYKVGLANVGQDFVMAYQLTPGFKFIGNLENGWQPYLNIDMNWLIGGRSGSSANHVGLPEMYSRPWLEYGIGLQKRWGERFTGYGQAMFRGIGRQGVSLGAGLRWRTGEGR